MVRFMSCAIAALAATSVGATTKSLRSTNKDQKRNLSYEYIAGYLPNSSVTDHNAIDLDQQVIVAQVAKKTDSAFALAKAVYEDGGHSKSYAKLKTDNTAYVSGLADGTLVTGSDDNDNDVVGKVYKSSDTPTGEIWLQYQTNDVQASYVGCQVGALSGTGDANYDGCFKEDGELNAGTGGAVEYTYVKADDNHNGRTIQGFSTAVQSKMLSCTNCPYRDAKFFHDYYGDAAYADKWVQAALSGGRTDYTSGRGNADFSTYGFDGRAECVKKGTAYMNIFMYVVREFEDALDDCKSNCINCNDDPVHAWDEGVAFYSGTLEGTTGDSSGQLLHQLADKRCQNFGTCYDEEKTKSTVNKQLLDLFNTGQDQLLAGRCNEARETKEKLVDIMYIPLIQGTIRYAYKVDKLQGAEKEKAEGAVFAAAVLPRIHAVNADAADTIYQSMRVGASSTDFKKVKEAFESTYDELNLSCSDIGGLLENEADGLYYAHAGPCKSKGKGVSRGAVAGIVCGSIGGVVAIVAVGYMMHMRSREKQGKPIFAPSENPEQTTVY